MHRVWQDGECWLCDADDRPVLWIGPVQTDTGTAPMFACKPCIRRLEERVRRYEAAIDNAPAR
ncbi:hypothetical protein AN218_04950 [Streptomyces nanshensis]|uniref:Uncharacterized protein n=1 Tax=Streptomyces nanshensis TaxID=518642 RepID=A0A1E7LAH8_9ACTN|nr:hypothetical protein AN218_04950 [Streptomyces nanshensis]